MIGWNIKTAIHFLHKWWLARPTKWQCGLMCDWHFGLRLFFRLQFKQYLKLSLRSKTRTHYKYLRISIIHTFLCERNSPLRWTDSLCCSFVWTAQNWMSIVLIYSWKNFCKSTFLCDNNVSLTKPNGRRGHVVIFFSAAGVRFSTKPQQQQQHHICIFSLLLFLMMMIFSLLSG